MDLLGESRCLHGADGSIRRMAADRGIVAVLLRVDALIQVNCPKSYPTAAIGERRTSM
jgi:hypothetical protein